MLVNITDTLGTFAAIYCPVDKHVPDIDHMNKRCLAESISGFNSYILHMSPSFTQLFISGTSPRAGWSQTLEGVI